ncbi:hypothetical protein OS242_14700 [Tumebacillus sp. DT12]|uniref:DUF2344 domain-containing protein n=1 Tax=Tumebacillus lacus TaxID=2995335 RepID=A0ABT3X2S9_9BACL|nr:hypothetical protein [Tumebacillus lacus]MCX7571199.1 hypothetical protein [Tumebacillus lacus]
MTLTFHDLDEQTRHLMVEELELDQSAGRLYLSPRLNEDGLGRFPTLLKEAMLTGDAALLASKILQERLLSDLEPRKHKSGGVQMVRVSYNAHEMLAEGEFNKFYVRALCRRALGETGAKLRIYRAKPVTQPRHDSLEKIGQIIDPVELLADLRGNLGVDAALKAPSGPNSGLSVELVK